MAGIDIHVDADELRALELDLRRAPLRVQFGATREVSAAGRAIDREMRIDASGHRRLAHLADAVTHEMIDPFTVEVGLGPDGNQGSLAHIIVYGSVNNGPVYDHMAGPRRALPGIERSIGNMAEDAVLGGKG